MDDSEQVLLMPSMFGSSAVDAVDVPLPDSPDGSLMELPAPAEKAAIGPSDASVLASIASATPEEAIKLEEPTSSASAMLQSPARKAHTLPEAKPMSPEKAALAAMFDSIKMPPPTSPSKSPRKASSGSSNNNILSSPSKQVAREAAPTALSLFRKSSSSPTNSPSKVASSDSAASRHYSRDSPLRRPVVLSSSSPGRGLLLSQGETKNASTPLSPAPASASVGSRPPRMRPSMLASSSSPSARLSDLSLTLDTTGTQELLFNQDASFLAAAANTAADVTIDDSFDLSRAKARIASNVASASTRRSSPAKFTGYKAKPRCSMVPEEGVAEIKPSTPGRRGNALGLRGLGVGRVVKNAAGDDTIELNLTGSFMGNSSMIGGNLMDESGEASLLFGNNSFSISGSHPPKKDSDKAQPDMEKNTARRGSSDDDDEEEEEEDFERDAAKMQKWAAEAARKAQLGRQVVDKTLSRQIASARAATSTVTRPSAGSSTVTKPVSRLAPRPSLVTPTAGSRLLKPRTSAIAAAKPEPALSRSGSASAGLSSLAMPTSTPRASSSEAHPGTADPATELKTPMRSRRKSTFTSSRPPVSGPARRRESLAAAAIVQAHPIPALPSLAPATPGRSRTTSAPAAASPMKTPTAATRTIPKPRASLTGRTNGVLPTSRASTSAIAASSSGAIGSIPRPRASLTSSSTTGVPARPTVSSSALSTRTPSARAPTVRSASIATPTPRAATSRTASTVDATPTGAMRKSASQPHKLDEGTGDVGETPTAGMGRRTLVPRASMSRISVTSTGSARGSQLATPRVTSVAVRAGNSALMTPSTAVKVSSSGVGLKSGIVATSRPSKGAARGPTAGGFGFKPRTSAVHVGATGPQSLLLDGEDKEN
ncbi:uncharacterized protein UTRI_01301_B [Ustilago trichophora]|uniref:Uncharacterized protein n=1 Tax=Ustilago trichophora TaxID=86804 RepID=A0A5C3DXN9_9BASI|nr:uncharacterized protein UTRI_01301_B [Ustilago trichophora]